MQDKLRGVQQCRAAGVCAAGVLAVCVQFWQRPCAACLREHLPFARARRFVCAFGWRPGSRAQGAPRQ
eukprot:10058014-Lingulodinium_polyedra.AAC.1